MSYQSLASGKFLICSVNNFDTFDTSSSVIFVIEMVYAQISFFFSSSCTIPTKIELKILFFHSEKSCKHPKHWKIDDLHSILITAMLF